MNHFRKNKGPNTVGQRPNEELWTRTGTFVNKPQKGWLHIEEKIKQGGVCYGVLYVGCIEVKQSMRTLPFEMRGQVTKEAIFRVCDAAGFRYNRKKKGSKSVSKVLGDVPNIQFGGANVNLTISTSSIILTIMETGQVIASHQMQGISFASGGDTETPDYVAYVGKDPVNGRACHILECLGGLAQDTITTIGQAFEIRFKDYLKNPPQAVNAPDRLAEPIFGEEEESAWGEDPEYYNDISKFANFPPQEPFPPLPPPGQYMKCENVPDSHPYQPLGAAKPTAPIYDNRDGGFDSRDQHIANNQRQPAVGMLLDIDDIPPAPALDNPLSNQVRRQHSQNTESSLTSSTDLTTSKSACELKPTSPVKHFKRCTPLLYDNPPHSVSNDLAKHKSRSPDWRGILEAGYDNLRIPWNRSRKSSKSKPYKAGNSVYDEPRFDSNNYDNPKMPLVPQDMEVQEGFYNVPTPNQPLNIDRAYNGQPNPSPVVDPFDMEPFNPDASLPKATVPPPAEFSSTNKPPPPPQPRTSPPVQHAPTPPQLKSKPGIPPPPTHKPPPPPVAAVAPPRNAPLPPRSNQPAASAPFEMSTKSIHDEEWFHGPMTRKIGEALLDEDGDFLVRESTTTAGQYVLSGMLSGQPKHLLLVDPQGKVRTKDKVFESVSHLINYHRNNNLPIISGGSHVYLLHPVLNAAAAGKHYN